MIYDYTLTAKLNATTNIRLSGLLLLNDNSLADVTRIYVIIYISGHSKCDFFLIYILLSLPLRFRATSRGVTFQDVLVNLCVIYIYYSELVHQSVSCGFVVVCILWLLYTSTRFHISLRS